MKIGIDLSPIQGPHRMRGIGYTLINIVNYIPESARKKHSFVFYVLPDPHSKHGNPLDSLKLDNLNYEIVEILPKPKIKHQLPGRMNMFISFLNSLIEIRDLKFGDSRIRNTSGVDVFLQTDQSQCLPRSRKIKKLLVVYDIIPYTLEWDYLWSYKTARNVHGFSRKAALRCQVRRFLYAYKLKLNTKRADHLLAISETTCKDFLRTFPIKKNKITVTPLGVKIPDTIRKEDVALQRYISTSWGYLPFNFILEPGTPFILFVGGADRRRKLQDLVSVFNNLRSQNIKLKLVLAGDSMKGPRTISNEEVQTALARSSYQDDIIFMGFPDDTVRDWLYEHALAFIFPSRYEGFGLPVLEAMSYGTPVIAYYNAATEEVAKDVVIFTDNSTTLQSAVKKLLNNTDLESLSRLAKKQAAKYTWDNAVEKIFKTIVD